MKAVFSRQVLGGASVDDLRQVMLDEAQAIHDEDVASCRAIGQHGGALVPEKAGILTHCNAGALATAGYGTALGVIRGAIEQGRSVTVFADETRPVLQGARLTAWELVRDGIDTTVISDNMAAVLMRQGRINFIVVGADRIAANGDAANKIGTYTVAVLAKEHGVPFYVAAPLSTIDMRTLDGDAIPIEERNRREVTHVGSTQIAPDAAKVYNPAFDVTPSRLIAGIITERGVARAPYTESLKALFEETPVAAGGR
jgi:methylthioribose-1-phosphate isomerase